jgi:4'-phosphopantetheinyl transferase
MVMLNSINIDDSEIHVWLADLDTLSAYNLLDGRRFEDILPNEVLLKATHRRTIEMQSRYIAAQASLRIVIARYLDTDPAALTLNYSKKGKPFLAFGTLGFNLSDSYGLAAVAVANNKKVGVDIEQVRQNIDCMKIARRRFRSEEADNLSAFTGDRLTREFFRLWVRKEAYLKAIGSGISGGLDCRVDNVEGWTIVNLDIGDNFAAAVAADAPELVPKLFSLI